MKGTCSKCGNTDNYNFTINNGLCDICIEEELDLIEQLKTKLDEMKKALNMEEAPSQFHPKIPYKWKYEHEIERTKRQSKYIQKLQAELDKHHWIPVSERLPELKTAFEKGNGYILELDEKTGYVSISSWPCSQIAVNVLKKRFTHWKPVTTP